VTPYIKIKTGSFLRPGGSFLSARLLSMMLIAPALNFMDRAFKQFLRFHRRQVDEFFGQREYVPGADSKKNIAFAVFTAGLKVTQVLRCFGCGTQAL